jgi:hypothetical protein
VLHSATTVTARPDICKWSAAVGVHTTICASLVPCTACMHRPQGTRPSNPYAVRMLLWCCFWAGGVPLPVTHPAIAAYQSPHTCCCTLQGPAPARLPASPPQHPTPGLHVMLTSRQRGVLAQRHRSLCTAATALRSECRWLDLPRQDECVSSSATNSKR